MPALTAPRFPVLFHVDYNLSLEEASIGFPIFVDPFVDINASYLRMETGEDINMEGSTGNQAVVYTAHRIGLLTFRATTPTT